MLSLERLPERAWTAAVVVLAGIAGGVSVLTAFSEPLTVQDDARQFLLWMAVWNDESLFQGDLVADYWRSVTPWLFSAIYRGFNLIGLDPVDTARILPSLLFPATAFFTFRLARRMAGDASVACFATACVLAVLISTDDVVSATPRAFASLLLALSLEGIARRSATEVAVGLFCLAGIYPNVAVVAASVLPIALIDAENLPRLDLSKQKLVLVGSGLVAALAGVLPVVLEGGQFGPVVTPDTAGQHATFGPGGRSSVLGPDGRTDFVCHPRIGLFQECDAVPEPLLWLALAAAVACPVLLLIRDFRTERRAVSAIPLALGLAGVAWFAIGMAVAFKLHLPSRFVVRVLPYSTVLPFGLLIGEASRRFFLKLDGRTRPRAEVAAAAVGVLAFLAVVATQSPRFFATWTRPELAGALMSHPPDTMTAGFVEDTDFVPLFARRPVLFSRELSVAYHLGYYRQIEARMRDLAEAEFTTDSAILADRLQRHGVDLLLVETRRLTEPQLGKRFAVFLGDFVDQKLAELGGRPTALSQLAPPCRRGTFDGVDLLDAQCLIDAARR